MKKRKDRKMVLYISGLPPPMGGVASWMLRVKTFGLSSEWSFSIVNARMIGRKIHEKIKFNFNEIRRTVYIFSILLFKIIFERPSIIHINISLTPLSVVRNFMCICIARLFFIPTISHFRGNVAVVMTQYAESKVFTFYLKKIVRMVALNLVQNTISLNALGELCKEYPQVKLQVLPGFIEDSIFDKNQLKKEKNDNIKCIFAGAITRSKGCVELLEVAHSFPEVDFLLAGELKEDMRSAMSSATDNVSYLGPLEYKSLHDKMMSCDFFIFPTYTEGFPNVVLEAMAHGLAIISTTVGALPEMIDQPFGGYLVTPKDVNSLIAATKKMIQDPVRMIDMGCYNKQKAQEKYSYSVVIKHLIDCYDKILTHME